MKSYREMAGDVFSRINENKNKKRFPITVPICCLSVSLVITIIITSVLLSNKKYVCDEKSTISIPFKSIQVIDNGDGVSTGEFVGDIYRPDGYDMCIGSALALKINISEDKEERFSVVFYSFEGMNIDKVIKSFNINVDDIYVLEDKNDKWESYLSYLTAEQIFGMAADGIRCVYVGLGKEIWGNIDRNWEDKKYIDNFCEKNGDMMIFSDESHTIILKNTNI